LANHEEFIKNCYRLATSAVQKGNHPFGALLVKDGELILTAENTVNTERDSTRHAELNLVSRAARQFPPEILSQCILYTSTEPCVMCTGAIYWVGIPVIVFGCSAEALGRITNGNFVIPCREILERMKSQIEVIGPILEEEGIEIHKHYW